jgi:hypothetical protein
MDQFLGVGMNIQRFYIDSTNKLLKWPLKIKHFDHALAWGEGP